MMMNDTFFLNMNLKICKDDNRNYELEHSKTFNNTYVTELCGPILLKNLVIGSIE